MKMHLGRRRRLPLRLMIILGILVLFVLFEAYRFLVPFVARNPLYHEVTIGQPVIHSWTYGGEDQEGYLQFRNISTGQDIVLPPTSQLFGADGQFVVIERADSGSLTFAEPLEGAPPIWYAIMVVFVGTALWLMMHRRKVIHKRRMNLRRRPSIPLFRSGIHPNSPVSKKRKFRASSNKFKFFR